MTARRTPQVRDFVCFPQDLAWLRDFIREVADSEGLSISDTYLVGAAEHWRTKHKAAWKEATHGVRRGGAVRLLGR